MRNKIFLALSVFLLFGMGILNNQNSSAYAEGVTPSPSPTKGVGTGVVKQVTGIVVGIKRLSPSVEIITLDIGVTAVVNPATDHPSESLSLNFTKIKVEYTDNNKAHHVVAKSYQIIPSTPPPTVAPGIG